MSSEMSLVIPLFPTLSILLLQYQLFVDVACFRSHAANDKHQPLALPSEKAV